MVGGLGDGGHGLHARKSRAALDQARAGEALCTRADGEERERRRRRSPATAMIVDRSAPPHQLDEQPDGEHTRDHTEG
jgi:hypothetical protein